MSPASSGDAIPLNLLCSVEQLRDRVTAEVATGRWIDAAMAAAGLWQATDDVLGATTAPVTAAAARIRRRIDHRDGRLSLVLDAALRTVTAPGALTLSRRRQAYRWRSTVLQLALGTAALAVRPPGSGSAPDLARRVSRLAAELGPAPPMVRRAVARIPSSFRSFDQHPDDVAALIERFLAREPDRTRPIVVVGVRTSGSYLAPLAVEFLRRAGVTDVAMVSARPYQWYLGCDARTLRNAARRGAVALVIDDPPNTGHDVARVCAELARFGLSASDVVPVLALFDEAGEPPTPLAPFDPVTLGWSEWSIHRRLGPEPAAACLGAAWAPAAVGIEGELAAPTALPRAHSRRLYRVGITDARGHTCARTVLAVGTGLGYFGDHDAAVAHALGSHVPNVLGRGDGVLYLAWPEDARTELPSAAGVVDYVCARRDNLPVGEDPSDRLRGSHPVWEVASDHLARVWGRYWLVGRLAFADRLTRRLLRTACPSVTDGDMRPATWLVGTGSDRPVKTSFAERSFSNFDLASFDDQFDVVGAAVHTDDAGYARSLRSAYLERTGRPISPERWLSYELVHLWDRERLALTAPETVRNRKSRALRRYLAEVLLADVETGSDGPLVVLDVDGVLETEPLGFRAPTPTGVLCLRALRAHGFRTVLATGRCLDDVVEMTDLFGLAGGAAEYGSVVYDRQAASVSSLVTADDMEVLGRLRDRLLRDPAVRVDARHRFSVRASAVDERGGPHGSGRLQTVVPSAVRAVVGEEQTDFVSARVDKLTGTRALVRQLGGDRPVLAVGDTASDAGVLDWALASVVPRHADRQARAAAGRIAPRPYQLGLAYAVGTLLGHQPGECARCAAPTMTTETRTMLRLLRVPEGSQLQSLFRAVPLLRPERPADTSGFPASG